jgi:large subunit ribosomal protein L30e
MRKDPIKEIRDALKQKKLIIGTLSIMKNLKSGRIKKVFVTSNCPSGVKEGILHYAKLAKAEVVLLKQPNDELGALCKKPFSISVLGV